MVDIESIKQDVNSWRSSCWLAWQLPVEFAEELIAEVERLQVNVEWWKREVVRERQTRQRLVERMKAEIAPCLVSAEFVEMTRLADMPEGTLEH